MKELKEYQSQQKSIVLQSMIDYMNIEDDDFDCGYSQKDIDKCSSILDIYIDELIVSNKDQEKIVKSVEKVIIRLNDLNNECEYCLIETDQREDLCRFIEEAAVISGLPLPENDITEEWREW